MKKIVIIFFMFLYFANYSFGFNNVTLKKYGVLENSYYVMSPSNASNNKKLPLVIFLHGRDFIPYALYEGFIQHIVDNGNIVVYPIYQSINTPASKYTEYAYNALLDFISDKNYKFNKEKVLYVGHSAGGAMAFNLAVLAKTKGDIPYPKGIFSIAGGSYFLSNPDNILVSVGDLSSLTDTKVIFVVGDDDKLVGIENSVNYYDKLPTYIFKPIIVFDSLPNAKADHYFVCSLTSDSNAVTQLGLKAVSLEGADINELDYELWKLYDQFENAIFKNSNINLNKYHIYLVDGGVGRN